MLKDKLIFQRFFYACCKICEKTLKMLKWKVLLSPALFISIALSNFYLFRFLQHELVENQNLKGAKNDLMDIHEIFC